MTVTPAEFVGDAQVVAIGENNHHIHEFGQLRLQLVQRLVDDLGFSVVAMESGFAEGLVTDAWLRGDGGEFPAEDGFTFRFGDAAEIRELLTWLRGRDGITFAGLDLPGSGGSPLRALDLLPDGVDTTAATAATAAYAAANNGLATERYTKLDSAGRDAATAAVEALLQEVEETTTDPVTRHHALATVRLDRQLREFDAVFAGTAGPLIVSSRDEYMAETVRLLRERHPGEKIVVLAHNGHIQRIPYPLVPGVRARSMGTHLAEELGERYRVLGVTAVAGTTTEGALDTDRRHGIAVTARPLDPPAPGSVEAAVGTIDGPVLADLATLRPTGLRHAHLHAEVDVATAFDVMLVLPTMSPCAFVEAAPTP